MHDRADLPVPPAHLQQLLPAGAEVLRRAQGRPHQAGHHRIGVNAVVVLVGPESAEGGVNLAALLDGLGQKLPYLLVKLLNCQ